MSKEEFYSQFVICECGYHNKKNQIKKYGTCNFCGKVLDPRAKLEYEIVCRCRLWKDKKRHKSIK